jgi:transcriptional regulator with XRE-family HTH domain
MPSPLHALRDLISDKDPVPNKLTRAMGLLVAKARQEAGLNQAELAERVNRRRATITDIENGKSEISTPTLILLAAALNKPLSFFLPEAIRRRVNPEPRDNEDHELLAQFHKISQDALRRIAILQVKLLADIDIKDFLERERPEFETHENSS